MSKSKIVGMMALIAFAMGILLVGDVVAGEKFKLRTVKYITKWEQVNVGDEEGHIVAAVEAKGITTNKGGKKFGDGWVLRFTATFDINPKAESIGGGYEVLSDSTGDKWWRRWDGKLLKDGHWEGKYTIVNGTGKFEGIRGTGTFSAFLVAPMQFYSDEDWDIELPR